MNIKKSFTLSVILLLFFSASNYAFSQSQITLNTDKSLYGIGDLVNVSGNLLDTKNYPIAIEVKDSSGQTFLIRTLQTDSAGNFELQFKIPSHAMTGDMQIITSTKVGEETITQTKVVPLVAAGAAAQQNGGCLIATAVFGSELAPQVQMLREIRDDVVLKTNAGASFMSGFNEFYYTLSPTVADWERSSPVFKESVKLVITPLITTLSILNYVDIDSDLQMLGYGMSIILLNIGMYFIAPVVVTNMIIHYRPSKHLR